MLWLRKITHQLTSNPQQSWKRFQMAVGLFLLAVLLILGGTIYTPLLQIPGLILLVAAIALAVWGYAGILLYRLTLFSAQSHKKPKNKNSPF